MHVTHISLLFFGHYVIHISVFDRKVEISFNKYQSTSNYKTLSGRNSVKEKRVPQHPKQPKTINLLTLHVNYQL